ncbi:MAG: molybdenum cofactor biosynthesis protein MoaE [Candidatus Omnitrophica bacterium]|nr:molybdenum cofactor biosynthesis protein MoaE [Candidatus Omnitrophota bacterium]
MFAITTDPINCENLTKIHTPQSCGAKVSFEGIVRPDKNVNQKVISLLYIGDEPLCISEGERIISEAIEKFCLAHAVCVQRIGMVSVHEAAIWIGVWSTHRDAAFQGCRYIIEEVKKRLLIWKKEFLADGTSQWVRNPATSIHV